MEPPAQGTEGDRQSEAAAGSRRRQRPSQLSSRHTQLGPDSPLVGGSRDSADFQTDSSADVYEIPREDEQPIPTEQLEGLLPGPDPSRRVNDWGRSESFYERLEPILKFLYSRWFRVECRGLENIPEEGGAFIVGNSTQEVPPEAAMIAQAIRERFGSSRHLYMLSDFGLVNLPVINAVATKLGVVSAHPANARRLLSDEGRLVLVFPEKYSNRGAQNSWPQQVTQYGRGGFVSIAVRAKSSIVPVAVAGSDDAFRRFEQMLPEGLLGGLARVPIRALNQIQLGRRMPLTKYLPAKIRIEFLKPVSFSQCSDEDAQDIELVQRHAEEIRSTIQQAHSRMTEEL